jgi:DNA-binding response OmpR family regulator
MAVGKTDAEAARLKGVRVLLVEDDGDFAPDLLEVVRAFGCRIAGWAPRLPEAFALSATRDFDVALLDINIGGHSVQPFAAHVRQKGKPMVFVTGSRGVFAQADEMIVYKPFEPDELKRAMMAMLQRAGSALA